jgi:hypothetical protein
MSDMIETLKRSGRFALISIDAGELQLLAAVQHILMP